MVVPLANAGLRNVRVLYALSVVSCKNDHQINRGAPFFLRLTALFRVRYVNWAMGPIVGTCAADPVLRGVKVGDTRSIRSKGVPKTKLHKSPWSVPKRQDYHGLRNSPEDYFRYIAVLESVRRRSRQHFAGG